MTKAVLLLSGGLDSTLAGKLLMNLGIEVEALNFTSPFCNCTPRDMGCSAAKAAADQIGIPVRVKSCGEDYLEQMKNPRFGRGSGMNACIDCRIHLFSKAGEYMREIGADFIATGEVLGERPMSQRRHPMMVIERESGLSGLIVRPLSAQHLPESLPEQQGLIDRSRLLAMQGRSRKAQFELAEELDVKDYLCPAGGCLLTDKEFSVRFAELLEHQPDFNIHDARLLRYGRHFRLPSGAWIIIGRRKEENPAIERAAREGDALLIPKDAPGPSVLLRHYGPDDLQLAARILVSYMKDTPAADITMRIGDAVTLLERVEPIVRDEFEHWRVGRQQQKA